MIPKIIHYCWFGRSEKPKLAQKCIASWHTYCPEYEIIEWNEDNFAIESYPYAQYCYENKKYAFLSDFARLAVVKEHGGIYFDTDVELVKSPDPLLEYEAFFGFENETNLATGLGFGAEKGHHTVCAMYGKYMELKEEPDGSFPLVVCPQLNTEALVPMGLRLDGCRQNVCGAEIFPKEYFNPYDDPNGVLNCTSNTISIHWYSKSWMDKKTILRSKIMKPMHRIFGTETFARFRKTNCET